MLGTVFAQTDSALVGGTQTIIQYKGHCVQTRLKTLQMIADNLNSDRLVVCEFLSNLYRIKNFENQTTENKVEFHFLVRYPPLRKLQQKFSMGGKIVGVATIVADSRV